eukprot:1160047-Pelagomonas_calceolata.AAC.2
MDVHLAAGTHRALTSLTPHSLGQSSGNRHSRNHMQRHRPSLPAGRAPSPHPFPTSRSAWVTRVCTHARSFILCLSHTGLSAHAMLNFPRLQRTMIPALAYTSTKMGQERNQRPLLLFRTCHAHCPFRTRMTNGPGTRPLTRKRRQRWKQKPWLCRWACLMKEHCGARWRCNCSSSSSTRTAAATTTTATATISCALINSSSSVCLHHHYRHRSSSDSNSRKRRRVAKEGGKNGRSPPAGEQKWSSPWIRPVSGLKPPEVSQEKALKVWD